MDQQFLEDVIQWDVRNWSRAILYWEGAVDWSRVETCLEVGAKRGGLSLWLASKGKRVVCTSLEDTEATAGAHHRKYQLDSLVEYRDIDATDVPYENHFDLVAFKSVLGTIGNSGKQAQQAAIDQMYKALKPGGVLLFAENLAATRLHLALRKRFNWWAPEWRYITIDEMHEFLRNFSRRELLTTGVLGTFGRSERQRQFLGALDQRFLNYITPRRWQYIVYGIAEK